MTLPGPTAPPEPEPVTEDHEADSSAEGELPLSPRVVLLWRMGHGVIWFVITLIVFGFTASLDLPVPVWILCWLTTAAVGIAITVLLPAAQYRRWRYQVTPDGIELRHGLVVRNQSSIPHFRVQHVDLRQGVLQRWLGIVSLSISTASPATDASLPGLDPDRAEHIRRQVIDRAEADDGV